MIKVRFAPSATGYLHAGNARLALVNFLAARAVPGGRLLLRIDDADPDRARPEYEAAIEQDLQWLGIDWDEKIRQSDRLERYRQVAAQLEASGRLYPCFETEEELESKRLMRLKRKLPPIYDRAMLSLTPAQRAAAEANGKQPYFRFRLSDASIGWNDLVLGRREIKLGSLSDPVLIRADGTTLPLFASVIDDVDLAITRIIRGEEHLIHTAIQIDLLRAMAPRARVPDFAHLPLMADMQGDKLAKRAVSVSLRTLRRDGIEPGALAGYLARLGSRRDPEPLTLAELAALFDLADYARGGQRFDPKHLLALNRKYLHHLDYPQVADRLPEGADAAFWRAVRGSLDLLSEARHWWTVVQASIDAPDLPEAQAILRAAHAALPPEPWDHTTWKNWTHAITAATGAHGKALLMPLRLALTGESHGPELAALLPLIGAERVCARLDRAIGA